MSTPAEQPLPPVRLPGGRTVSEDALRERATTSGGPGGQHVNKTATRVELRVAVDDLQLSERERQRLEERLGSRITRAGELVVSASGSRSQLHNRREARVRLEQLIGDALAQRATRVPTRVPRAVVRRIQEQKRRRSAKKSERRWRPDGE